MFAPDGRSVGLNLTRAVARRRRASTRGRGGERRAQVRRVRRRPRRLPLAARPVRPTGRRCLEAQVMDWSDDIAYSVHDLEDAVQAGHLRPRRACATARTGRCWSTLASDPVRRASRPAEVEEALDRLLGLPCWPASYDGSHRALAGAEEHDQPADRPVRAGRGARDAGRPPDRARCTRYAADLVVPREARVEVETLKAVADRYVMSRDDATKRYAEQRTLVRELGEALLAGRDRTPPRCAPWWTGSPSSPTPRPPPCTPASPPADPPHDRRLRRASRDTPACRPRRKRRGVRR